MSLQQQRIEALCEQLKLQALGGDAATLADQLAGDDTTLLDFLEAALRRELDVRQSRSRHTLAKLAADCGVSERTLTRLFVRATGITPLRYQQTLRTERAEHLIRADTPVKGRDQRCQAF